MILRAQGVLLDGSGDGQTPTQVLRVYQNTDVTVELTVKTQGGVPVKLSEASGTVVTLTVTPREAGAPKVFSVAGVWDAQLGAVTFTVNAATLSATKVAAGHYMYGVAAVDSGDKRHILVPTSPFVVLQG